MRLNHVLDERSERSLCAYLLQFVSANRLPETIGYNIVYFAIGVGLVSQPQLQLTSHQFHQLGLVFLAVMLTKMQASIADVIHDYTIDKAIQRSLTSLQQLIQSVWRSSGRCLSWN